MTALEDLAAHDERVAEAQARARALGRDLAEHNAKITELKSRKIDAHSREDEQLATEIRRQIDAADAKVIDLEERQQGAEMASRRADAERTKWIADHYRELVAEIEPEAREAARAIDELAEQLLAALKAWQDVSGKVSALGHTAGQTNQRPPSLGWDEISHSLRRRPKPTPVPLPQFATAASIVPEHDPDPEVRERARQEVRASGGGT